VHNMMEQPQDKHNYIVVLYIYIYIYKCQKIYLKKSHLLKSARACNIAFEFHSGVRCRTLASWRAAGLDYLINIYKSV